ncbi:ClpX C4-type zinc finger protein [Streptomyces sp. NBC_01799]|nr:ClpX C4-type zinc finger protein [Streptomyces sp. NBC_01800]WSA82560.1 ClpX C4-type zinc finger protein [Streptomyces sp. NBC_01799]
MLHQHPAHALRPALPPRAPGKRQADRCSFCGHARSEERRLVAGPDVWICSECVALCGGILAQPADAGA